MLFCEFDKFVKTFALSIVPEWSVLQLRQESTFEDSGRYAVYTKSPQTWCVGSESVFVGYILKMQIETADKMVADAF